MCHDQYMRRTTISLPDALHDELRAEAIRLRIQAPEKAPRRALAKRYAGSDPLLKVAGICSGPVISANIDDE